MKFRALVKGYPFDAMAAACEFLPVGTKVTLHKVTESRHGAETHYDVTGDCERAMHAWFQAPPGKPPFPAGTLLHFSYVDDAQLMCKSAPAGPRGDVS